MTGRFVGREACGWWLGGAVGLVMCLAPASPLEAQQVVIDRVLARVGASAVTLTDLRAARGLGLVEVAPADSEAIVLQRTIDRRLVLDEVTRFPPPEPSPADVEQEVAGMKSRAGSEYEALVAATGLDEARLRQLARESLRIRAYIGQRFGTTAQVTEDEVRRYYEDHQEEFRREDGILPFAEAESVARQRASATRLRTTIDRWIADLRMRAEVVVVGGRQ